MTQRGRTTRRWWAALAALALGVGSAVLAGSSTANERSAGVPAASPVAQLPPGALDAVRPASDGVEVIGWAIGDGPGGASVEITADGRVIATIVAGERRLDAGSALGREDVGFRVLVEEPPPFHTVCAELARDGAPSVRLGCGPADPTEATGAHRGLEDLVDDLGRRIEATATDVRAAIAVIPFDTGRAASWRGGRLFVSASTAKAWWTAAALAAGQADAAADVARPVFEDSSDALAGTMIDLAGGIDAVNAFTGSIGMTDTGAMKWNHGSSRQSALHPGPLGGSNHVTADDAALFFYRLGTHQVLSPADTSRLARWMRRSPRDLDDGESEASMLTAELPTAVAATAEHKAGWLEPFRFRVDPHLLDAGIIRPAEGSAYAIAIIAAGPVDGDEYRRLQAEIRSASCHLYRHLADEDWRCRPPR